MAYGNYLASVPADALERIRRDAGAEAIAASRVLLCSHLLAFWIKEQPIGALLGEAIDGGQIVHWCYWHPARVPLCHSQDEVRGLAARLRAAWDETVRRHEIVRSGPYRREIEPIVGLFEHAASRGEAVISALQPPLDLHRAQRVRLPISIDAPAP